ncbi:MAG: glycosyltransferase [Chloroflexi bacterium]|nr:glycosyltransferase [Chloroflexota bacterium]
MAIVGAIEIALALISAYLLLLTAAAFLHREKRAVACSPTKRFAVLIPAHDEELLLGRLLDSLGRLDYPNRLFEIYVVADNCSDGTARVAREHRVKVLERENGALMGKGHALNWLFGEVSRDESEYDAFVVLDADSTVTPTFLAVLNDKLMSGSEVVQAYYTVANPAESWSTRLRFVALALVHYLRPLGKRRLGASAGLKGNGMCFARSVIEQHGWKAYSLAEDVEHHLELVLSGIKVDFAPDAIVRAEMPTSLPGAHSQNLRWERGRLVMVRRYVPRLIWSGLRTRNLAQVDAALEQLVPPFSVPVALSILCTVLGLAVGSKLLTILALGVIACQLFYIIGGLVLVGAPPQVYLSLLRAPVYVAWKAFLYVAALFSTSRPDWIRTSRT